MPTLYVTNKFPVGQTTLRKPGLPTLRNPGLRGDKDSDGIMQHTDCCRASYQNQRLFRNHANRCDRHFCCGSIDNYINDKSHSSYLSKRVNTQSYTQMNNPSYSPDNLVASARKRAASRHYHHDYYGFRRKFQKVTNSGYNFDGNHSNETIDKAAEYSLKQMLINEYLGISGSNTLPENRYLSNNYESIDKLTQLLKNEHGGIGRRSVSILPRYDPRSKRESSRMSNARRVSNDRQKNPRGFSLDTVKFAVSPTVPGDVSPHSRNMASMNNSPLSVRDFNRSKDQNQDGKRKTENERTNTPEIYQESIETSEKTQSSSGKRNIAKFEERFNHLLKFKAENGHCNPPSTPTSKHASLGKWANHVRLSYRQLKNKTQPHIRLTDSHIKQLSDIGFVWELRKKSFEVRFQELTDFKAKHGHCNVPTSRSSEYFSLGEWCRRLKQSHARMLDNRKPLSSSIRLTKERIQELEAIGFDLKVKKRK